MALSRGIALSNDIAHRSQPLVEATFNSRHLSQASFKKTGFSIPANKVFQANEFNKFQSDNKDLYQVISKSDKAQEIYSKKDIRNRDDLVKVIAEAAHEQLQGESKDVLTADKLAQDPQMASLVALNTGGIRDLINQDKSNAEMLLDGGADLKKDTVKQLAEKAANLFEKGHALNNKEFFENNPKAAVYVLQDKNIQRDFTETEAGKDRAEQFRDKIKSDVNQDLITNATNNFIQDNLQSGTYTTSFLDSNPDFTDYLAASLALSESPTAGKILKDNPQYNLQNRAAGDRFNYDEVVRDIVSQQASDKLNPGSEIKEDDFKKHTGLARLVLKNVSLQDAFKQEDAQNDFSVIFGKERPKIETPNEVFQRQFQSTLKERTLVSVIA